MSDIVCGCMGMTKDQILEEVKTTGSTKAGTGCGGCKSTVETIVAEAK